MYLLGKDQDTVHVIGFFGMGLSVAWAPIGYPLNRWAELRRFGEIFKPPGLITPPSIYLVLCSSLCGSIFLSIVILRHTVFEKRNAVVTGRVDNTMQIS